MSTTSIHETNGALGTASTNGVAVEHAFTVDAQQALVARAKDIIAGRIPPDPIPVPSIVVEFLDEEFRRFHPQPTAEARRFLTEDLSLQAIYKGTPIASIRMSDRSLAVLAVGEDEIRTLLTHLNNDENADVVIRDTDGMTI